MARRLLSHLLISLAILSLMATFFIWVFDATVLNPTKLTKALNDGGVPSALANIIPEKASETKDNEECNNTQMGDIQMQPQQQMCAAPTQEQKARDALDQADMKAKIASVVTPEYVNKKIQSLTSSVIGFMKNGNPQPTIDISDFPERLKASGVEVGDDMTKDFGKPVELNKDGALNDLPGYYKTFKLVKYAGAILFVLLLAAEWFVTEKGQKLRRTGRIFLHAGLWYTVWWIVLVFVPARALPSLKDKIATTATENTLVDAVIKSIQNLFGNYFLGFAIVCWVFALAFYLARHSRKHVENIQAIPDAKDIKAKAKAVPNKR